MASPSDEKTNQAVIIATRGSALALVQAKHVQSTLQGLFPQRRFELKVFKTTGDQLQALRDDQPSGQTLPKGLFTKELEVALLDGTADLAVHSLKDLPTELPTSLCLGAITQREDAREMLILKQPVNASIQHPRELLPKGAVIATNSPRRAAQIRAWDKTLKITPMRGNVPTRLAKLAGEGRIHGSVLAVAGLNRLGYSLEEEGRLIGPEAPEGLFAHLIETDHLLPCVGQGCLGIEIREGDQAIAELVKALEHAPSAIAAQAERHFLKAMGGGCQTPYAAHARLLDHGGLKLMGKAFHGEACLEAELQGNEDQAVELGEQLAEALKP